MYRAWMVLAVLSAGVARAAGPSYTAEQIVHAASLAPGPAAPNSYLSLFGLDLAWAEEALTADSIVDDALPTTLADVRVYVANYVCPLFYVSPTQINFLIPGNLRTGQVPVRVVRQGVTGPEVLITLVDAAPQLFPDLINDGFILAQHADYAHLLPDELQITPDHPAHPGEIIVVYANGLGITQPNPGSGEIPRYAGLMTRLSDLRVTVGGTLLGPERIWYAGLTPGWPGLYQINMLLPEVLENDPEIRVAVGDHSSMAGMKVAVRPQ